MSAQSAQQLDEAYRAGRRELAAGRLSDAQQAALRILRVDEKHAGAYLLLGMAAAAAGRPEKAEAFIDRTVSLADDNGEAYAELARVRSMLGKHQEAVVAAGKAESLPQSTGYFWDSLGVVYSRAQEFENALRCFREATRLSPETPAFFFNLGSTLQFLGKAEAADAYERSIEVQPRFYRAHFALAEVTPATAAERYLPRLLELRQGLARKDKGIIYLSFALAGLYDKLGRYDEAFDALAAGNVAVHESTNSDISATERTADRLLQEELKDVTNGCSSDEPIFILGMPRTGTTLVDRILSNHSQVYSAGEMASFSIALKRSSGTRTQSVLDEETVSQAQQLNWTEIGEQYLQSTRPATGQTAHFIDKTPLNFLLISFIHRALPNAGIVCLRRHPLDTVLGNYRQLFALNLHFYDFAYDLEDCARFYVIFDRLMRHWDEQLPGRVLKVQYEDLISNQETVSRQIIEHCGLAWEPACLRFDTNPSPVATASAAQVRESLYTHAVGRWKRYEKQLEPARRILEDAGIPL